MMVMRLAEPKTIRWSRDEYYRMAELGFFSGRRVELIEGEIIEMSPQDPPHAAAIRLLDYALKRVFGEGYLVCVQSPLSLGLDSDPEPDLAVVRGSLRDHVRAHPDHALLVVEVADSSLQFDRTRKAALYAEARIGEYWIINLRDRRVEAYRRPRKDPADAGSGDAERGDFASGEALAPVAGREATIPVADLLP